MNTSYESTYALLVRSEEKSRSIIETGFYALLLLSAIVSIWQFVQQPIRVLAPGLQSAPCLACATTVADHKLRS
jgi:hypothetical protein